MRHTKKNKRKLNVTEKLLLFRLFSTLRCGILLSRVRHEPQELQQHLLPQRRCLPKSDETSSSIIAEFVVRLLLNTLFSTLFALKIIEKNRSFRHFKHSFVFLM